MKQVLSVITIASLLMLLMSCSTVTVNSKRSSNYVFQPQSTWGIAPFNNNTDVPQAGTRAMSITAGVLRAKGVADLAPYPSHKACNELIICPNKAISSIQARHFAMRHHIRYMVLGAVNEWQYKVGLDGEPVASVTIQVFDVERNQIVWSSVGSRIGSSHSGLSVTAQDLINNMLNSL